MTDRDRERETERERAKRKRDMVGCKSEREWKIAKPSSQQLESKSNESRSSLSLTRIWRNKWCKCPSVKDQIDLHPSSVYLIMDSSCSCCRRLKGTSFPFFSHLPYHILNFIINQARVNLNNRLAQSAKSQAFGKCQKRCHSVSPTP